MGLDNETALIGLGDLYIDIEDYESAEKTASSYIKIHPHSPIGWSMRGYAKSRLKQYKDAIEDYNKAIEPDPHFASAWNNRGVAKARLGQLTEAVKDFRRAMSLDPDNEDTIKSLQSVLQEIEVEKLAAQNTDDYAQVSERMRNKAGNYETTYIILYAVIACLLLALGLHTYYILSFFYGQLTNEQCKMDCFINGLSFETVLPLSSTILLLTLPLVWLIRMLVRVADDMRIMSEDYMRNHIIENRIELFFKGDDQKQKQKELHETFINHMMTNSPVETLLKLRKRNNSNKMNHPWETMIDKIKEVRGSTNKPNTP